MMVSDDLFVIITSHTCHDTHHKIRFWSSRARQISLCTSEVVSHRCVRETFPVNRYCSLHLDALTVHMFTGDIVFSSFFFSVFEAPLEYFQIGHNYHLLNPSLLIVSLSILFSVVEIHKIILESFFLHL